MMITHHWISGRVEQVLDLFIIQLKELHCDVKLRWSDALVIGCLLPLFNTIKQVLQSSGHHACIWDETDSTSKHITLWGESGRAQTCMNLRNQGVTNASQ